MIKPGIALVCTSVNQLGGKNNHLKNLYHGLKDTYEVFIIVASRVEEELREFMSQHGVEKHHLIILPWKKKWLIVPFVNDLAKVFKQKNISIVHTFQMQSDVFGGIAARLAGIKILLSYYESKMITENDSLPKRFLYQIVNYFIKDWFLSTVVVSYGLKREIEEQDFRSSNRVEVIHLGIKIPPEYMSKEYKFGALRNGKPVIGTIARFSFEKALDRIVEAAPVILQKIPGAQFILIGKGPDEEKLRLRAAELRLNNKIVFQNWTDNVFRELECIDIFLMPSIREGCPTALLEALAVKRPTVASDIEGIKDIIKSGFNGILVNTTDTQKFAETIIGLCADPERAIRLGQKGFDTVKTSFIMEAEINKLKNLYSRHL